jgi:hypothetical protein
MESLSKKVYQDTNEVSLQASPTTPIIFIQNFTSEEIDHTPFFPTYIKQTFEKELEFHRRSRKHVY